MSVPARLFAPDGEEIADLPGWLEHAPPEQPIVAWRDGYSAKEQARAWLVSGPPAMPEELSEALGALTDFDNVYGRPEHPTKLDDFRGRGRQHDMFACLRQADSTSFVAGIEAKAGEDFGGLVSDRAPVGPPSNRRARCNLLARALFGREVVGEATGEIIDVDLAAHGYQLWTAAVGTLREAQRRNIGECALVVHQFVPADIDAARGAGDLRDWPKVVADHDDAVATFTAAFHASGARSHETPFVQAGTKLHVLSVRSTFPPG